MPREHEAQDQQVIGVIHKGPGKKFVSPFPPSTVDRSGTFGSLPKIDRSRCPHAKGDHCQCRADRGTGSSGR